MRTSSRALVASLALVFVFTNCTKKKEQVDTGPPRTPEQTVEQFVRVSASAETGEDKAKLEALCAGEMRRAFDRMTEEMFKVSYLGSKVEIEELKILQTTQESPTKATVRYRVTVKNPEGTDATTEVNEREVELTYTQKNWFIDAIKATGTDRIAFTKGMIF